jgi:hypothetical protein
MATKEANWIDGRDREKRLRISHELQQLEQMSKSLRMTAMRSFMKRTAAARPDIKRPEAPVKPTSVAA